MGLISAWQQYRQNQIDVARDQLRNGHLVGAQRNNVAGRLQRLESRKGGQQSGRSTRSRSRARGSGSAPREVRDVERALKRYSPDRPDTARDLSRSMLRLQRRLGNR